MSATRVLWIDLRRASDGAALAAVLPGRYRIASVDGTESAVFAVRRFHPDVAGIEFDYPDAAHLRVVPALVDAFPTMPILMFTEYHSEALAVWAFRAGVRDYRVKPVRPEVLADLVAHFTGASARIHPRRHGKDMPVGLMAPGVHLLTPPMTTARTAAAAAYIAAHYGEPIRQRKAASLCHLSASEFSRVFRREHGVTFERFLLEFRIAKARDLLLDPRMTITNVAHAVGFNESSYFARAFRQMTGITASEWRQRAGAPSSPHAA